MNNQKLLSLIVEPLLQNIARAIEYSISKIHNEINSNPNPNNNLNNNSFHGSKYYLSEVLRYLEYLEKEIFSQLSCKSDLLPWYILLLL